MRFRTLAPLALLAVVGCQTTKVGQPLAPELAGDGVESQLEFWHALPERKAVSNDEAFHALLLFADGADPATDYAGRMQTMKERRMLPANFNESAADVARRGTIAYALARALGIKGGLTMQLFGTSQRYAVRELQYAGLFPPSSPQQTFSGAEFLGIMGRAEDYQRNEIEDAFAPAAGPAPVENASPNGGA
jgi:hypothetical protein